MDGGYAKNSAVAFTVAKWISDCEAGGSSSRNCSVLDLILVNCACLHFALDFPSSTCKRFTSLDNDKAISSQSKLTPLSAWGIQCLFQGAKDCNHDSAYIPIPSSTIFQDKYPEKSRWRSFPVNWEGGNATDLNQTFTTVDNTIYGVKAGYEENALILNLNTKITDDPAMVCDIDDVPATFEATTKIAKAIVDGGRATIAEWLQRSRVNSI